MGNKVERGELLKTSRIFNRARNAGFADELDKSKGDRVKFVALLIDKNNGIRLNNKTASEKTKQEHKQILFGRDP